MTPAQSEELKAAYQRIEQLETALRFYADPFRHPNPDDVQIPDFYSECDFGRTAEEVLS